MYLIAFLKKILLPLKIKFTFADIFKSVRVTFVLHTIVRDSHQLKGDIYHMFKKHKGSRQLFCL
jgi:hypothetical protein